MLYAERFAFPDGKARLFPLAWREPQERKDSEYTLEQRPRASASPGTDRAQDGELYMPMNSTTSPVNLLTGSLTDPATHTPAHKETAVQMEVLARAGESPLPLLNHRFGRPTPQSGVEVDRKWRQPGYRFPGELVQIGTKREE